ncbi:GGDEF domain-containing protein [Actinoplanes bogorensis]|uniref:GGDEF domain-containing protein n=2 Tax=Paractinoplanes bogorensis TaxID=1610840 RepID=A0ABS5Z2K5_9ACTN|nr:GGDEF domain-containing protein [Actinoplanes bogorensis]
MRGDGPYALTTATGVLTGLLLLRLAEFRTGRLVPAWVDLLELAGAAAMLSMAAKMDPVLGVAFFSLLSRAATGRLRRLLPLLAGYLVVFTAGSLLLHIPALYGAYGGMVIVPLLVFGMRLLLLRLRAEQQKHTRMIGEVLSRLPLPVLVTGSEGEVLLTNPAATELIGPLDELRATLSDGTPVDPRRMRPGESGLELRLTRGDSQVLQVVAETVLTEHGTIVALQDVTAQRGYEERLEYVAYHDSLTGLPNRAQLWRRLAEVADRPYSMLLVDLDGFKQVNDTLGHLAGDELLCFVAERLRAACGPTATVARLGGDEFAVLLPDADEHAARTVADAVRSSFHQDVHLTTGPVRVGGSLGTAVATPNCTPDEVLATADAAMYANKHARLP